MYTGLDPAGPWFEHKKISVGLNRECADFVDVVHTHGGKGPLSFGLLKPLGHVDFYVNGGQHQPGCVLEPRFSLPSFRGFGESSRKILNLLLCTQ